MVRRRARPAAVGVAAVALGLLGCGDGGGTVTSAEGAGSQAAGPATSGADGTASRTAGGTAGPSPVGGAVGSPPDGAGRTPGGGGPPPSDRGPTPGGPATSSAPHADPVLDRSVILDFAVEWRPESELSDDEVRQQRARIQAAQDEVLRDLGRHGRLRRPLHETAQASLLVDATGLHRLREHPRVAQVHDNDAEPASGG